MTDIVDVGASPNDGTGDDLRTAFQKINAAVGPMSAFGRLMAATATRGDAVELLELDTRFRITPLNPLFGAVPYDPAAPVYVHNELQAFYDFFRDPQNCRSYIGDAEGEWGVAGHVIAEYWDGAEPNVNRRFKAPTLRVAPLADLPGGVALDDYVLRVAGYRMRWEGLTAVNEASATKQYQNTTFATRRFLNGVHVTAFSNSYMGPVHVDGAIRRGHHIEGWEAGFTSRAGTPEETIFPGANSIGAIFGGTVARLCGSCQHWQANQGPATLTISAISNGVASGAQWTNAEIFTAGGGANLDQQRSKLTTGGGTTTAGLEILDMGWGRVELIPAIYGTVQVIPDANPETGTVIWTTGDPTNLDGAGNGLEVGDIYPIFQAGLNAGKAWRITGFSNTSNRTIAVARENPHSANDNIVAEGATADPTHQQFSPLSWHTISRVIDTNNFTVDPFWPARLNSGFHPYFGGALKTEGDDLAIVTIGPVDSNICGSAWYHRGNFAPNVATVLGQSNGITLRIGDQAYGGGLGHKLHHGHSEGSLVDLYTAGGFSGYINLSSFGDPRKLISYSPRSDGNEMEPAAPRHFGPCQIITSDGAIHNYQYGGTRENYSGQNFISNGELYRHLYYDGSFGNIEVRYDETVADRFVKTHWAEITAIAATGNAFGSTYTLTLSKKMQAQGWTFDNHHGAGVVYTMPVGGQSHKLRLLYQAGSKRVGIQRSQYYLSIEGDIRSPNSLYVGEYSSGAGFLDGKEIVLRNSSGYGLRAAMNGASGELYLQNVKNGVGLENVHLQAKNLFVDTDVAGTLLVTFSPTAMNLAAGKVLQVNGTQVVGPRGAAVADATDAASAITQLNLALARMRAHGLIA